MPICKILLKNQSGTPRATITIRGGKESEALFPAEFRPIAAIVNGGLLPLEQESRLPLPSPEGRFSVLGTIGSELLFATTARGEAGAMDRWRLFNCAERETQRANLPTTPLPEEETPLGEENAVSPSAPDKTSTPLSFVQGFLPPADSRESTEPLARAKELLTQGEPFFLFTEWMPNSQWAKIESEECPFLVGIVQDEEKTRVLYGIAGSRAYPPDEDRLWRFFPTDEENEEGYYLTEAT